MSQLFLDLDGVLADFNGHYKRHFGAIVPRAHADPPGMWDNIRSRPNFYRELPIIPDALELWQGTAHLNPIVLTGVPFAEVPDAAPQKRAWLREHLGENVPLICCRSRDKRHHGKPGDVLVDDWDRYRQLWIDMGGVFVIHTSAKDSLAQLQRFGYCK